MVLRQAPKLIAFDAGASAFMDRRRVLAAALLFSLASCSRHEPLAPVNYSPSPSSKPSDVEIRTAIVQQSIRSYQGSCPCPYSAPNCQGRSAYDKPGNQSVYCYTKDIPVEIVTAYRAKPGLRTSNGEASGAPTFHKGTSACLASRTSELELLLMLRGSASAGALFFGYSTQPASAHGFHGGGRE